MCLQETHIHINHCSIEQHNGFWFLFSSEISNPLVENAVREFAGIGFIISPEMWRFVVKFDAVNSRVARLSLRCHGNPVHLFSVYAPHSGRPSCDKEQFHQNLRMNLRRIPWCRDPIHFRRFQCKIAFCTRWGPSTGRTPCLGQRLWFFLSSASPNTLENWDLFVDFLKAFVHIRKFRTLLADLPGMQLDMPKLITALHRRDGKNSVQNVEAFPDAQTDSDHFLVVTSLLVKLKANKKLPGNTRFKFKNPSPEQILHFNSAVSRDCRSLSDSGEDPSVCLREFNSNILTSARESFSPLPRQQRKSYLSDETWRLIELKRRYRIIGDKQAEIETRKLVRHSARKDKVTHLVNSFENAQHVEDRWKSIRSARKKFVPRFVRFKNRHGEYIDFPKRLQRLPITSPMCNGPARSLVLLRSTPDLLFLMISTLTIQIFLWGSLSLFWLSLSKTRLLAPMISLQTCWSCSTMKTYNLC